MADETKKEDDINSLYKKYFTPELCDEQITNSKLTLKHKLQEQLYNYGKKIVNKNFETLDIERREDAVIDSIEKCFAKWTENPHDFTHPKAYFSRVINDFAKRQKKKQKSEPSSLNISIGEDDNDVLLDLQEDKTSGIEYTIAVDGELDSVVKRLDCLEKGYVSWGKRKDANTRLCLSAILTFELSDDFFRWGTILSDDFKRNYSFVNSAVLKLLRQSGKKSKNMTQAKLIEVLYGMSATRASHIRSDFEKKIKELA